MGTRYEDQPVEQWAGPESLDPTPVWKQYILVALLLFVGLALVVGISVTALWPNFVTPPALVPGDRFVLASSDLPVGATSVKFFGAPLVDEAHSFYLVQPVKGRVFAFRAHWRATPDDSECALQFAGGQFICGGAGQFAVTGEPGGSCGTRACASRALDQYLVSVSGDRVIVNLSRLIESSERTGGPVPTGIPQPQTQQP